MTTGAHGRRAPRFTVRRILIALPVVSVLFFGVAQLIPYGRAQHANPPVLAEPAWDSPHTRELAVRACFACHSNETDYPFYANIAPISWLVQSHVSEGRGALNFSEWNRPQRKADEAAEQVAGGSMPPWYYTFGPLNNSGRLTPTERQDLIRGLEATLGVSAREGRGGDNDD